MKLAILSTLLLTFASKSDGRRGASLPTRPPNPDLCYRICVAIHHDPDQIEQCKYRCNTSSDEASSFVASSASEERTPSLEEDKDDLDISGAFVLEDAAVGLRGSKPSEAQTDEYDGFQPDNAVSSFFGCGLCAVIHPNDPAARDQCLKNGGCNTPRGDADLASVYDAFDKSTNPQSDTTCTDECDRKYSPQQYIKRILCSHLECNKEDAVTLGNKGAASQQADTILFKDGPNTDEGSVTCEDICKAVFGGTGKLDDVSRRVPNQMKSNFLLR
jgi:hypothetical protein